jgi:hypothetical protein
VFVLAFRASSAPLFDEVRLNHPGKLFFAFHALNSVIDHSRIANPPGNAIGDGDSGNPISQLAGRIQTERTLVGEESGDQRSDIPFGKSVRWSICGRDRQGGFMVAIFDWTWKM